MARTPQGSDGTELSEIVTQNLQDQARPPRELPGGGGVAADAGEYVLGTLDAAERARFEALVDADPEARGLAAFWRDRLASLDAVAAPVAPRGAVWNAIEAALPEGGPVAAAAANDNALRRLRRSRNGWRFATMAAALLVAAGAVVATNPALRGEAERRLGLSGEPPAVAGLEAENYLAVVNAEGKLPAMIVRVDGATGQVSLRPLAVAQPEGRSLEVWHIPEGTSDARSLGTLDEGTAIQDVAAKPGDTFALTEEPAGGSPTGVATGPIVYSGQLIREP